MTYYERSNWKSTLNENCGTKESINFNYYCIKFSQLKSFFFTVVSYLLYSQQHKQFLVPFIDRGSRWEEKLINISQNEQEKTWVGASFIIKTSGLEL